MLKSMRRFIRREEGMGTVEIVIIIAVLVGIALLFRTTISSFASEVISGMFPQDISSLDNSGK